ncbi:GNAT family N-acetyltransferase [Paracoccus tibetensis]|uniref:L-amino acid N-acyltransferase YncA n=1 Tax=Paracoccus tibetensis TaxID=336292 RepID=A0A1G5ITY2_9RHOB|nr:GNAT family N-acetyltransferase [Paracoccus tibetensis]SCY79099.1 L-amino acid N-acyltransferase YncA [Paracoccus tibetensis]
MIFRRARAGDLAAILALLVDDRLGAERDSLDDLAPYRAAFAQIDADPRQLLAVAEDAAGRVVATLQLTFIPGLSRGGALRGQIEAVRVASDLRGRGIGAGMIAWAIEECRRRGCALVQLTTDRSRTDAHRFYDRLGFEASHLGYKMVLR